MSKMLKFIRGRSQQTNTERQRLQRELFGFCKTVQHGFPNKPTSIAWDPELRVIAIGTATGAIKIYGKPGVEFYGHLNNSDQAITKLLFIPKEGRLISLCNNSSVHLWVINSTSIEEVNALLMEGKLKNVSCLCLSSSSKSLYIGTEGGNIYTLNLETFEIDENGIYQDVIMQNLPEEYKIIPGAVEIVSEQPGNDNNILIGYTRGPMVLWNKETCTAVQVYANNQQLESLCWNTTGSKFVSSHNDGSYTYWSSELSGQPLEEPVTIYGPFPCKAITKILWKQSFLVSQDDLLIFSGGMPRASYSDRHTVTVQKGSQKHVVFDFSSKVVDFLTISSNNNQGICEVLMVLAEEELVAIDLTNANDDWRMIPLPYLNSLHASVITCSTYISDVSEDTWKNIIKAGKEQIEDTYSSKEWLINGGTLDGESVQHSDDGSTKNDNDVSDKEHSLSNHTRDILITGHEDGSVRFWNAGSVSMSLLYVLKTSTMFCTDDFIDIPSSKLDGDEEDEEEEWPPFKKVGCFDPFSDDPRLAIKKIVMCSISDTLVVAGAAGQIIIYKFGEGPVADKELKVTVMNNVREKDNFIWKGHKRLGLCGCNTVGETENCSSVMSFPYGYQPSCILQLYPPAIVTALSLYSSWFLIAGGTSYGLSLFDYYSEMPVLIKCTLDPSDFSAINEPPISRTKSFKKSLRESFRRIRKGGRSTRQQDKRGGSKNSNSPVSTPGSDHKKSTELISQRNAAGMSPIEIKPVERAVEARSVDDNVGSMVRCLYFADSFVVNTHHTTPTLWAGTNNGTVYIFTIHVPQQAKRHKEKVTAMLGKEIQLRHKAPVVSIAIIDGMHKPLPEPYEVSKGYAKPADNSSPHHVIIASEEQFKLFSLPGLKPICKLKLTAIEGARVRRICIANFSNHKYSEACLLCLTNLGECIVLSIPELRRVLITAIIKKEDITGISSLVFTKYGEALFLISSSEMQRIALSASHKMTINCSLGLPANVRKLQVTTKLDDVVEDTGVTQTQAAHIIANSIPEEDEEEIAEVIVVEEKEKLLQNDVKVIMEDISEVTLNNISAITVDSVQDHLANLSMSRTEEPQHHNSDELKQEIISKPVSAFT